MSKRNRRASSRPAAEKRAATPSVKRTQGRLRVAALGLGLKHAMLAMTEIARYDLIVSARVVGHHYGARRSRGRTVSIIRSHVSVVLLIERPRRMPITAALVCLERSLLCPVVRTGTTGSLQLPSSHATLVTRGC